MVGGANILKHPATAKIKKLLPELMSSKDNYSLTENLSRELLRIGH